MGISNTLIRQMKANSQMGTDMGGLINMTFNSIILAGATTFGLDPTKATMRQAVNVYQANEYIKMFDVPIEYQQTPSMVKQWCIENSKIGANEYPFPKVSAKDLENWNQGKVYRYSEKQLAFINREYLRGELEFAEGSIRAGKSLCMRARKTLHFLGNFGSRHALVAYSYSSARRLMLDSEGGFLEALPFAKEIKGQEQTRLVFKGLLYPYEEKNVYVISAHDRKSASAIVGMDLDTIFAEEYAHLNGEAMEQLNQRCAHSPFKLISLCSNPIGMDAGLLAFLRLFTGVDANGKQVMDTENSHHRYHHTTFTMIDNPIMAENPDLIKAVEDEYKFDQTLFNEKVLGRRSTPKGLVLAQFKEPQHVLERLTKDVTPRTLELFASADFGYSDTTAVLFYLKYYDHMGRPHCTVLASYSHAVHKYCTMKGISVGDLSPQEHIQNILSCWIRIKRALSAYYPEKIYGRVRNGYLLIDPSNKAEINQANLSLQTWQNVPELFALEVKKADNNSKKQKAHIHGLGGLHHVGSPDPYEQGKSGAELGFANINRSFYMNRLDLLRDPSSIGIDDLENAQTINEIQVYQRKPDGSLILQGKDHLDAVHSLRYGHNHLQTDFFGSYE